MLSRRRLRWTVAIIAITACLVWLGVIVIARVVPVLREPRSTAAAMLQQRIVGLGAGSAAAVSAVPAASAIARGANEREICGVGWVKVDGQGPTAIEAARIVRQIDLPSGRRRMVEALRADPSERALAMAALLEVSGERDSALSESLSGRIAETASRSADPVLYAFALRTCGHRVADESSCRLLSPAQWARLDPGNAAPWFEALGSAVAARDQAGRNEALHRIATSDRLVTHAGVMARVIIDHAPADDRGALMAWLLAIDVIGIEAAWVRHYPAIASACKGSALADANRRQTCSEIAELMVERSDDRIDQHVGLTIGEELDWPNDRVDRLRGESQAYTMAAAQSRHSGEDFDCTTVRRDLDFVRSQADIGEVEKQRRWLAASGRTADSFVVAGRRQREEIAQRKSTFERDRAASASAGPRGELGR